MSSHAMFVIDPDYTLSEAWQNLASTLEETGAQDHQIEAMQMTFFMGASQVYAIVNANSRGGRDEFNNSMDLIRSHIEATLRGIGAFRGARS
jgi:hypothetical protein